MLDKKLAPIDERTKRMELTIENDIMPRLQNIEACYTGTYDRYKNGISQIENMQSDIEILKKVVREHSEKLNQIA